MAYKNSNDSFYEVGSAARKREYVREIKPKKVVRGKVKLKPAPKKKYASLIAFILCAFVLTMFVTYRYNLINEKNLEAQSLKRQLDSSHATLLNAQIEVEQNTDLNKIESYAKQQLGMQKPDKNQTVYVDTSKTSKTIELANEPTQIEKVFNDIIQAIKNIF